MCSYSSYSKINSRFLTVFRYSILFASNLILGKLLIIMFVYPSHRGYISFVNTCVTPWHIDLDSMVTFDKREILRHLSPSVCSNHDCVQTQIAADFTLWYTGRYWKWALSIHRIWYLPYKSNRYTGVHTQADGRRDRHSSNVLEFRADQMSPRNLESQINVS